MHNPTSCTIETLDHVSNSHKDNYNFQFYCLCAVAAIGSVCFIIAVIALILTPFTLIGVGLATVSAMMCSYGFFKLFNKKKASLRPSPELEVSAPPQGLELGSLDNSLPEALTSATCSQDPAILLNAQDCRIEMDRAGSLGHVAARQDINCLQTLVETTSESHAANPLAGPRLVETTLSARPVLEDETMSNRYSELIINASPCNHISPAEFKSKVQKCIDLLRTKAPLYYEWFLTYNLKIRLDNITSSVANFNNNTIDIGTLTFASSLTHMSAEIIHECIHFLQFRSGKYPLKPDGTVDGEIMTRNELEAIEHQILVLQLIEAPLWEIEHLQRQNGKHWDTSGRGIYGEDEFKRLRRN